MTTFIATTDDETFAGTDGVTDTVDYGGALAATDGIVVAYTAGGAEVTGGSGTDELTSIENIVGTAYNDAVVVDNSAITGSYTVKLGNGNDIFSVNQSGGTWNVDGGGGGYFDQISGTMKDTTAGYDLVFNGNTGAGSVGNITFQGIESVKLTLSTANDTATLIGGSNNFIEGAGGSDTFTVSAFHGLNNLYHGGTMPVSAGSSVDSDFDTFNLDLTTSNVNFTTVTYDATAEDFKISIQGATSALNADGFEAATIKVGGTVFVNGGTLSDGRALHIVGGGQLSYTAAVGQSVNFDMSGGVTHSSDIGQFDGFFSANILLNGGSNTITLGDGYDTIHGELAAGSTYSMGGGNDYVYGGAGDDTISGGKDGDILMGGAGSDSYLFSVGDGQDHILETSDGAVNRIVLGTGITTSDVKLVHDFNSNLLVNIGGTSDQITVDNYYGGSGKIQEIVFADGTIWTQAMFDAILSNTPTEGDDDLRGGDGGDTIHALGGNDAVGGGDGADQLYGDDGNDVLRGGRDFDHLYGGDGNDTLYGDDETERVQNYGTADYLDGGAGADFMSGGKGNDTYVVDNSGDRAYEGPEKFDDEDSVGDNGIDTVLSSISYTTGPFIEILTLTGTADINGGTISTGSENVTINGNAGNNILHGNSAIDTLNGGGGNDTYFVFNAATVINEDAGGGNDKVLSSVDFALSANVENLTITGTAVKATGNGLANIIVGDAADNWIDGGAGADHMFGEAGNDTYIVDNDGDRVSEELSGHDDGGVDTVMSSVTFHIFSYVENLTLTGSGDINATGNQWDNVLIGNDGKNVLNGQIGADTMIGGKGDDGYIVDNIHDVVIESAGEGTDKILSSVSYTLSDNVENMTLTGTGNINATGNAFDNLIQGNSGNNRLDGGTGTDRLWGGTGADTFVFSAGSGADIIKDFSVSDNDHIDLSAYTHGTADTAMVSAYFGSTLIDMGGGNTIIVANAATPDVLSHIVW